MRAMDSAIALSREKGWALTVLWRRQRGILNCRFDRLFDPLPGVVIRETGSFPIGFDHSILSRSLRWWNKGLGVSREESGAIISKGYDIGKWEAYDAVYIISYSRFHPNKDHYADFRPSAEVSRLIDRETHRFSGDTIGIHIRRTDNGKSIENSPLERFEAAIELELAKNDRTNFYVASDSVETKAHLQQKYGQRILCNMDQADRDSADGVVQAAVELYALSRTQRVYGSYWSSFSHTAAHIGGIQEFTVLKDEFRLAQ
jgi:hypothetical protein